MSKPKLSYFQFYPDDFISGTYDMTAAEVGVYIRLLSIQWTRGSVPADIEKLVALTGGTPPEIQRVLDSKFKRCNGEAFLNLRMTHERKKAEVFHDQCVKGGKARAKSANRSTSRGWFSAGAQNENPAGANQNHNQNVQRQQQPSGTLYSESGPARQAENAAAAAAAEKKAEKTQTADPAPKKGSWAEMYAEFKAEEAAAGRAVPGPGAAAAAEDQRTAENLRQNGRPKHQRMPNLTEVRMFFERQGCPGSEGQKFYERYQDEPIKTSWHAIAKKWISNWHESRYTENEAQTVEEIRQKKLAAYIRRIGTNGN